MTTPQHESNAMASLISQCADLQASANRASKKLLDASIKLIRTVKKLNAKSREIAEEHRANEAWSAERLELLARLNNEFASLIAESDQQQTTLDTLDKACDEASRLVNAKSLERVTERLENLKYELQELECERVQMEENAIEYSAELSEIDEEIQGVKDLIQSARYRVRTQS